MPSFTLIGSLVAQKPTPVASFVASQEFAVLGSVITLDGRLSSDPEGNSLSYSFGFISVPIGSKIALEGFRKLDDIGAMVSFSPDVVGQYVVGLFVSNGVFDSPMLSRTIDVRAILVPHARGIVPDGKFIWSYLRDVWTQVDGREFFETLWSALVQISGGELLKLYQNDWNKSIRDIQDLYQRRWLAVSPKLQLAESDCSFFLGNAAAGMGASTGSQGEAGLAVILSHNELLVIQGTVRPDLAGKPFQILYSRNPENVGTYTIASTTARQNGFRLSTDIPRNPDNVVAGQTSDVIVSKAVFIFDFQSTTWTQYNERVYDFMMTETLGFPYYRNTAPGGLDDVRVGDVIVIPSGVNAGTYRIIGKSGSYLTVDRKPPAAGTKDGVPANVYRPVGFVIPAVETGLSNTLTIPVSEAGNLANIAPGRVIVVNNTAYTITRAAVDANQRVPVVVVAVEEKTVVPGMRGLPWRVPHTLISKTLDFEALGVRPGDLLIASVRAQNGTSCDVKLQVVGASGNRLGFILSTEDLMAGVVPEVQNQTYLDLSEKLSLPQAALLPDQTVAFTGDAKTIFAYLNSIYFQRDFWNTELDPTSVIASAGWAFTLAPRAIVRNRLIPVDASVRSIPALQEYVVQPSISEEGGKVFQIRGEKKFELARRPVVVSERTHYVVDGQIALSGELTFRTGSAIIDADGGDFVDLGIQPGDTFHIESPLALYGDYPVLEVISRRRLKLSRAVPKYPLSDYVTGSVAIYRSLSSRYLRFIPGLFSAKNPAPNRLWAEVVFFDNSENIERNFGLLVGLSKADLEAATAQASYRQAVAGLMYAYVNGSAVNKIRLGVSLLLGLPFTEKRGIIRSIENDYRLDAKGNPLLGRILIEDVDDQDAPLGVYRIYTFPLDPVSELAGVDVNPKTSKPYVVGDVVEAFSSLSKGVEIADFAIPFSGSRTAEQMLQQYHSARVRINDNIFQPKEVALVSSFLRKITPSYVALSITNTGEFADTVKITDRLVMLMRNSPWAGPVIADTIGLQAPFAAVFDQKSYKGIYSLRWDMPPHWVRRAGKDLSVDATNTSLLRVPSGGLLNQRTHELFESPLVAPGDMLLIDSGINAGIYTVATVPSDDSLTVSDGPAQGFAPATGEHFAIMRHLTGLIRTGSISALANSSYHDAVTNTDYPLTTATVETGLRRDGVGPGDWFVTDLGTRHTVVAVQQTGLLWNKLVVTPQVGGGAASYRVYRSSFLANGFEDFTVASDGTTATLPATLRALTDVGDLLQLQQDDQLSVVALDPKNGYLSPPLPNGSHTVKLFKKRRPSSQLSLEPSTVYIKDPARLTVIEGTTGEDGAIAADVVSWGTFNPASAGFRPGDLFNVLTAGANKTQDVGYGPGSYPIAEVSSTSVKLTVALSNGTTKWSVTRRL